MTDSVLSRHLPISTRTHEGNWHLFLVLILVATLFPLLATPVTAYFVTPESPSLLVYGIVGFLGANGHVASTAWFYTDPAMRTFFRSRRFRYFIIPVVLVVGSAAVFQFLTGWPIDCLLTAFVVWQLWHYQKQNIGLVSFVAAGATKGSISMWERRTLNLAAVAGICGFFRMDGTNLLASAEVFARLYDVGLAIYLFVPVCFCIALAANRSLRRSPLRLTFFLSGALFFAPTFIFSNSTAALVGYATAHGLQYLVFMYYVSTDRRGFARSMRQLLVVVLCGGLLLDQLRGAPYWEGFQFGKALYGAFLGLVMTHFVLDAGIWRLREPFQRKYMREKFNFVF